jgi:cytochrome c553
MKIVLSVVLALAFIGCSEEAQKETKAAVAPAAHKTVQKVAQTQAVVEEKVAQVKEVAHATVDKAQEVVTKTVEKVEVAADSAVETAKVAADSAVETAKVAADKVAVALDSKNGKVLYTKCAGCHGQNGEKKALGKSQVIQGWSDAKIADALNGYAKGTYGGAMKGIMMGQAKGLSKADIQAISEYISTL